MREDITRQYIELFGEEKPVPIYKVKQSDLGLGYRLYIKIRRLLGGENGGGTYYGLPFNKHIEISDNLGDIERDVVKHEVNHYLSSKSDPSRYETISSGLIITSLIPLTSTYFVTEGSMVFEVLYLSFGAFIAAGLTVFLYDQLVLEEKRAHKGTRFEQDQKSKSVKERVKNFLMILSSSTIMLLFGWITFIRKYIQRREEVLKNIKSAIPS